MGFLASLQPAASDSDGPQPSGCFNVLSLGASIFSNAWAFPERHLSSNTESDLDTNVVRTLMQPEGCGPSEFSHSPHTLHLQLPHGAGAYWSSTFPPVSLIEVI